MKLFLSVLLVTISMCNAEPPKYRSSRQENSPNLSVIPLNGIAEEPESKSASQSGPYAPSGWKPAGQRLELPPKQQVEVTMPQQKYGAPAASNAAPRQFYGPLSSTTTEQPSTTVAYEDTIQFDSTTTEMNDIETTTLTEASAEKLSEKSENEKEFSIPRNEQGSYYVLRPDSRLQKFVYSVVSDPEKRQYSSRIQSVGSRPVPAQLYEITEEAEVKTTAEKESVSPMEFYGVPSKPKNRQASSSSDDDDLEEAPEGSGYVPNDKKSEKTELEEEAQEEPEATYFILLPNSRLQRVVFTVVSDDEKQKYSSKQQSVQVEPVGNPFVVFTPQYVPLF